MRNRYSSLSSALSVGGTLAVSGSATALGFTSSSDARLKDAVEDLSEVACTAVLMAVKPKKYVRSDLGETTFSSARRVGFLSQDVQAAIEGRNWSNLLATDASTGALQLDYSKLVTVLWGAVRSLEARVAKLE